MESVLSDDLFSWSCPPIKANPLALSAAAIAMGTIPASKTKSYHMLEGQGIAAATNKNERKRVVRCK